MVCAFVLITVPPNRAGAIIDELRNYPEVREAATVYGEADIVAKVQTDSTRELDRLIMNVIQGIPDVRSTRTLVAIERLHWIRS